VWVGKDLAEMWNKVMITGRMWKSADRIVLGEMVHNNSPINVSCIKMLI
jgi:hypothetical protein